MSSLGPITKISANFVARAVDALEAAAEQEGDTLTDTLNRAVQVYARVVQIHAGGKGYGRFHVMGAKGKPCRVEVNRPWWRFW